MKKSTWLALFLAVAAAVSMHVIAQAQSNVGQNINVITGSSDQFVGDMFRQRQNESVGGISSVNPSNMMVVYNDYRTVDYLDDSGADAMTIEVAVFEIDARGAVRFRGEADLDLAGLRHVGVVLPFGIQLPGEHEPPRRLPHEDPAPVAFGPIHRLLVAAAPSLRIDDRFLQRRPADAVAAGTPRFESVGVDVNRVLGARVHVDRLADW
jgi:hypothetical protein